MQPPIKIPGYKIEAEIGQGAMATVYRAVQESLERTVALKVMAASLLADCTFRARFLKEGKTIARLSHPHIVTIYDIGVIDPHYYMAMEYVDGGDLKQRIANKLTLEQSLTITAQIVSALGYAHKQGFVHRDVKPANILFRRDGTAVLADFGISKAMNSSGTQLTSMGWAIGTPHYMSPEQGAGKYVDSRSDLYSLGIMFFEMLTGHKPFEAQDAFAMALLHASSPVPRLPPPFAVFQPMLDRLLAKDPKDRFENAEQLIKSLESHSWAPTRVGQAVETGMEPRPSTVSLADEKSSNFSTLRKWGWGVGLPAVVLLGAAYLYSGFYGEGVMPDDGGNGGIAMAPMADAPSSAEGAEVLNTAQKEKVTRLLDAAQAHFAVGRLRDPPGSNAYEAYQWVLEIDPGNEQARLGLREIELQQWQVDAR